MELKDLSISTVHDVQWDVKFIFKPECTEYFNSIIVSFVEEYINCYVEKMDWKNDSVEISYRIPMIENKINPVDIMKLLYSEYIQGINANVETDMGQHIANITGLLDKKLPDWHIKFDDTSSLRLDVIYKIKEYSMT